MKCSRTGNLAGILALAITGAAAAGDSEVVMTGLVLPIGLEADSNNQLWVSELGVGKMGPAGPGVGRISMMPRALDGTFSLVPLVEDIAVAFNAMGEPAGTHHITFDSQGRLLVATGGPYVEGVYDSLGSILVYDPTYGVLTAGPYAPGGAALLESIPVFPFIRQDAGYDDSNVYSVAEVGDDLWIVDAGANAVVAYDAVDGFSVVAEFPNQTNPKGTTPPTSQAVPTKIVPDGDGGAFVVQLTGFPFVDAMANVFQVAADGSYTSIASGLKTLVDIEVAADGSLLVCSAGDFDPATGQPAPGTGSVIRVLRDGSFDTFIGGLWLPTGVEVVGDDVFVFEFVPGTVTRYPGIAPQPCLGDLNGDGRVDAADLGMLIAAWSVCP